MSKYQPLTEHLQTRRQSEIPMQFSEIERVLGFPLPASSRHHRAWWSNNPSNSVMTKAWISAGYRSRDVDMSAERLVFERLNQAAGNTVKSRHPIFGAMKGMITVAPGVDLTLPADPEWGRAVDNNGWAAGPGQ